MSQQENDNCITETQISGPYTSGNLTVFLIHGEDKVNSIDFLTLDEAMLGKKVVVEETGVVSVLNANNNSSEHIFIQSGDIVKGGKQDRTLQDDSILAPNSQSIKLKSFCVESGRWRRRGQESESNFSESSHHLSSKNLKLASKYSHDQSAVWQEVYKMQEKAAKNLKISMEDIQNNDSPTSLHMTLDHSLIHETSEKYIEDLNNSIDQKTDVIGFAFAVNNEINGCDLYSTNDLFLKMWPKLLKSISIEAISELDEDATKELPSKLQVKDFINNANQANEISNTISGASKTITKESEKYVLFEMQNLNNGNSWIHRNYIVK